MQWFNEEGDNHMVHATDTRDFFRLGDLAGAVGERARKPAHQGVVPRPDPPEDPRARS